MILLPRGRECLRSETGAQAEDLESRGQGGIRAWRHCWNLCSGQCLKSSKASWASQFPQPLSSFCLFCIVLLIHVGQKVGFVCLCSVNILTDTLVESYSVFTWWWNVFLVFWLKDSHIGQCACQVQFGPTSFSSNDKTMTKLVQYRS